MQDICLGASPYEHTLIETQIHIKQSRETHKTASKKRIVFMYNSAIMQNYTTMQKKRIDSGCWLTSSKTSHCKILRLGSMSCIRLVTDM